MNEFFRDISKIKYEGEDSANSFSFKYYNPDKIIGNKKMEEHLRFSVAYWHTFTGDGSDPFGMATMIRPWQNIKDPMDQAKKELKLLLNFLKN